MALVVNKVCRLCKKKITEATYGLLRGKMYHMEEFVCSLCKRSLENVEAVDEETTGILFCSDCHHDHVTKKCDSCKAPVVGTAIDALGRFYHPHHFCCFKCKKLLDGNYYKNEDQPVCQECFETRKKGRTASRRIMRDLRFADRGQKIRLREPHISLRLFQM